MGLSSGHFEDEEEDEDECLLSEAAVKLGATN
jgi:hypothetical protein